MAILSAINKYSTEQDKEAVQPSIVSPVANQNASTPVNEQEYFQGKPLEPDKRIGFLQGFFTRVEPGQELTGPGQVSRAVGSIIREPVRAVTEGVLKFSPSVQGYYDSIDQLREVNPEMAAEMENEAWAGKRTSTAQNVTQIGAGLGELALNLIPLGLLGKAGRVAFAAKEAQLLSKLGTAGQFLAKGALPGASFGSKVLNSTAVSGAYGSLYGFLSGLEEGGDWKKALQNIPTYGALGAGFGLALPVGLGALGVTGRLIKGGTQGIAETISRYAPESIRPSNIIQRLPEGLARAILTEGQVLRGRFGEVGRDIAERFQKAREFMSKDIGSFQDEAARLGLIDAPSVARGAYRESVPLRARWQDREFRFAVRDAMTHEGIFADDAVRAKALAEDKHLADVVDFFNRNKKARGEYAQEMGVTRDLVDKETYFPRYSPEIGLKSRSSSGQNIYRQLELAKTDAEKEAIYAANNAAVDDMIEYGFRKGQWKSKLEGFKNYYDAMDLALGVNRIKTEENSFLKYLVEKGYATTPAEARNFYIQDLDNLRAPLTPRAASLDYQRKVELPWNDPDPMRVMTQYVTSANKRLAYASQFGVNDEVLKNAKQMVLYANNKTGGKNAAQAFEKTIRAITGQFQRAPNDARFSALVRGIEGLHLTFSQIINLASQLNYVLATDLRHFGAGLRKAFSNEGMRKSVQSGALASDLLRQTTPYSNLGDRVMDRVMRYSGFSYTEMLNRSVGVHVAESYAKSLVDIAKTKLASGQSAARELALLKELGLDGEKVIAKGVLDKEDLITAAQNMVENTQGGNNPLMLPGFAQHPLGKIFYQFKNFAYNQARFMKDQFMKDIVSKDTRSIYNAVKFITVAGGLYPMTYGALRDLRDIVTLKKRPEDAFELDEYFQGLGTLSAGGLFIDFLKSAQSRYGGTLQFLAGPTVGDLTDYLDAIGQLTAGEQSSWKGLRRQILNQTGVGQVLDNFMRARE